MAETDGGVLHEGWKLEPIGIRLVHSPKRTQRFTGMVGGVRLRRPQLGLQAPEVSN